MIPAVLAGACILAASIAALSGVLSPSLAAVLAILASVGAATYLGLAAMREGRTLRVEVEAGDNRASMAIGTGTGKKRQRSSKAVEGPERRNKASE